MIDGWVLLDKPCDITSFEAIKIFKKFAKVGHAGTLDPFASGCLLVAFGSATRLIEYAMDIKKEYCFTVCWGVSTTTYDKTGDVDEVSYIIPKKEDIEKAMKRFLGYIEQIPPKFSAIKIKGKRACDYARHGIEVKLKPRLVYLESIDIVNHNNNNTSFRIKCGKGFYVRSLAVDLAKILNTVSHVTELRRNPGDFFHHKKMVSFKKCKNYLHKNDLYDYIRTKVLPVSSVLENFKSYDISFEEYHKLRNGIVLRNPVYLQEIGKVIVRYRGHFVAVCYATELDLKPLKVFKEVV